MSYYRVTVYYRGKPKETFLQVNTSVYIKDNPDGTHRLSFDDVRGKHHYRNNVLNYTIDPYQEEV